MSFVQADMDNPLGQRPLNLMSRNQGMGWFSLGAAPTPGDYDNNQAVLQALVSMGAITQQNATDIFDGKASLDDMAVNMTMINQALQITGQTGVPTVQPMPGLTPPAPAGTPVQVVPYTPTPAQPAPPALAPGGAGPGQIPPGSTILYTASFNSARAFITANAAIQALAPLLPSHGMSVLQSNVSASGIVSVASFSVTILDSAGHALMSDAKSVLDALMQQITENGLLSSSIAMVSAGMSPGGSPNPQAPSVTTWLENNAPLVIGVILAVAILPPLIKKI